MFVYGKPEGELSVEVKFRRVHSRDNVTTIGSRVRSLHGFCTLSARRVVMPQAATTERSRFVERGRRLENFTILWNSLDGLTALISGFVAGSVPLSKGPPAFRLVESSKELHHTSFGTTQQ